jgi:dipeptidyl aminopeptidase/acylaminoacyl peptidase
MLPKNILTMKNIYTILAFCLLLFSLRAVSQELSKELTFKVEMLAKVGSCSSPSFSPDGKEIAFISDISGSPQLWKVKSEGGWPIQLTNYNDPVSSAFWSPVSNKVAFQLNPGGGMNGQVYLINSDGTGSKQITSGGRTNNRLGTWSKDGKYLAFSSNQQNPAGMDCYFYEPQKDSSKIITTNNGIGSITDINSGNTQSLLYRLENRSSNDIFLIDNKSKKLTLLTKHSGPGTFFAKFSSKGDVYIGSNLNRDLIAFGKIENNKIKILCERTDSELEDFRINHSGTLAILVWNTAGKNTISIFDLKKEKELKLLKLPVELVTVADFSPDDKYCAFTGTGSKEPTNIWLYDCINDTFNKITESPHPGIILEQLISPVLVKFKSFDGLDLSGWLFKPTVGEVPFPTVISFHGGPEGQSRPYFSYTIQALLSQGIAVFSPNVRGSSGFGKKFVNLDNGALRINGIKDIEACFKYITESGFSNSKKVGIMGGSYGGYMVMSGITEYPNMFAAAANLYGVVNFKTFFENTEPWMAAISKLEYGDPESQAEMLNNLSPINKVNRVVTPTIVLHGANDTNVPVGEAEQVVSNLKSRNIPVKYVLFPDEGHGWTRTSNKITSTLSIVDWFSKYLMK